MKSAICIDVDCPRYEVSRDGGFNGVGDRSLGRLCCGHSLPLSSFFSRISARRTGSTENSAKAAAVFLNAWRERGHDRLSASFRNSSAQPMIATGE
ncbi:hypothetical protein J4729_17040 [Leisingera sp. HS039]|uniref:hypothetical protein n=1 Tax=unclassified Leisingera TaxID=2614906 RepID=UPI001070D678|nr:MULTISPECIES: hypothetical protein [unclassified Leisingera]MBQ4826245.1 hypothetical protein [Leisingera sp. HS039]QBR35653.1 hypothetical protein ETW23_05380 [Leisingera sp. NJS201]